MKFIAIIAMSLTLDLVCSKCSSTEFLTPEGRCCRNPQLGFYITKNCTFQSSISAKQCRTCTGKSMKILANCTRFTDTKCEVYSNGKVTNSTPTTPLMPANILVPTTAVLLITMLIALFVVISYYLHKGGFLKIPYQV